MKRIWKINLASALNSDKDGVHVVDLPCRKNAKPLCVQKQEDVPYLWFEVDENEDHAVLRLGIVGTGFGRVPENGRYIGTVQDRGYVWHVYHVPTAK